MGETVPTEREQDQHRHHGVLGRIAPSSSSEYINDVSASTYTINSRASSIYTIHNSISQDKLVADSPGNNNTLFKQRPKRSRKEVIILCIALIVFAILTVVFGLLALYYANRESDICESAECIRTAANFLRSIDQTANPCEDFYAYACGRWGEDHPSPDDSQTSHSWFDERQKHMLRNIQGFLKQNDTEESLPEPVLQARTMYQACRDMEILEKLQIKPVLALLESLTLPASLPLPGSPSPNFNFAQISLRGIVFLAKEFLFGFDVQPHPRNTTRNYLAVGMPETDSPLPVLHNIHLKVERNRKERSKQMMEILESEEQVDNIVEKYPEYARFMRRVMAAFTVWSENTDKEDVYAPDAYLTLSDDQNDTIHRIVANVLIFQFKMDVILQVNENELEVPKELSVQELQNIFDEEIKINNQTESFIIWSDFFSNLFAYVNITFDPEKERILFYDEEYFKDLIELLAKTPMDIIESWMWWQVVSNALPHTDRVMREIAEDYFEDTIGVTSYKRSIFCSRVVNEKMGMAVSYFLADMDHLKGLQEKVTDMMLDIRKAFHQLVSQLHWMDAPTKRATIEKADAMGTFIGYPEWILDSYKLASYYPNVNISRETHLENLLTINQLFVRKVLLKLGTENLRDEWTTDATTINAFHTFRLNAISIPAGILQFPFYDLGLEAMNYGAIGAILGHELTHGFDNFGRYFDKNGNRVAWWSNETVDAYLERSSCFVSQYSGFYVPEVNLTVNGNKTLGENIADNGGIQEAILAYQLFQERRGKPEPRLPGLENFTPLQLFFLAYANVWCENPSALSLRQDIENDEHSPGRFRVKGVLSNSKEFAEAFHCPVNASLNPSQRCTLW